MKELARLSIGGWNESFRQRLEETLNKRVVIVNKED